MRIGKKTAVTKEITRAERNKRNNLRRIAVAAFVALVVFVAITVIQSSILNQEERVEAYQVIKNMDSGTKITKGNIDKYFALKDVQVSLIPDGYLTDKKQLLDKFVNRNYRARDIVTDDGISDTEGLYKSNITNPVEISFDASGLDAAVAGTIREGDYINIYGLKTQQSGDTRKMEIDSSYTFQHVYVEEAMDASGNRIATGANSDGSQTATMFTLVLSEKDCGLFAEMIANCGDNIRLGKLQYNTSQDYQVFLQRGNTNTGFIESNTSKTTENESEAEKKAKAAAKKQKTAEEAAKKAEEGKNSVSTEYKNALKQAETYSSSMHMSKQDIYDQLTSEYGGQFPADAAQYAIDNLAADYKQNALKSAETYQSMMSMSKQDIYDQLVSEYGGQFTPEEAQYAIDNLD